MRKLIKPGNHGAEVTQTCPHCGAVFTYDNRDIYVEKRHFIDRDFEIQKKCDPTYRYNGLDYLDRFVKFVRCLDCDRKIFIGYERGYEQ